MNKSQDSFSKISKRLAGMYKGISGQAALFDKKCLEYRQNEHKLSAEASRSFLDDLLQLSMSLDAGHGYCTYQALFLKINFDLRHDNFDDAASSAIKLVRSFEECPKIMRGKYENLLCFISWAWYYDICAESGTKNRLASQSDCLRHMSKAVLEACRLKDFCDPIPFAGDPAKRLSLMYKRTLKVFEERDGSVSAYDVAIENFRQATLSDWVVCDKVEACLWTAYQSFSAEDAHSRELAKLCIDGVKAYRTAFPQYSKNS